jgi:outer membrane protein assembly factor BamB
MAFGLDSWSDLPAMSIPSPARSPLRWRLLVVPVVALLVLGLGLTAWFFVNDTDQRQSFVVHVVITWFLTVLALLSWLFVWLVFLSRWRWSARLGSVAAIAFVIVAVVASVKPRGVSGDLVPDLTWRWAAEDNWSDVVVTPSDRERIRSPHDYAQFLGPGRDGVLTGVGLARDWDAVPPRERWRRPVGAGWSGFAVAGDFAVTLEQRDEQELVTGYDLRTGELRWTHGTATRFDETIGGPGPRSVPTIVDGRVYALGGTGRLHALELRTGAPLWSRDIVSENGAVVPIYGVSGSPLVIDGLVVVEAGGPDGASLVAYDAETGERRWSGGDDPAAYGSPAVVELAGRRQIVVFNGVGPTGHDAADGRVLWQYPWPDVERVSQPVVLTGDRVFVSTGYGIGGKLLRVAPDADGRLEPTVLWESLSMKAKFTDVVHREGYLYGLDDGILACVDVETGERVWKGGRYGHGQLILADDLLVVSSERGEVALVEATPSGYKELGRFEAIAGKTWGHPALAGGTLVVRNDREAACYELPLAN